MTCFQHCPEVYPFVIKEKNRNTCTNLCKRFRFQQECLDKCPDLYKAIHRGECVQCSQIGMNEENQHCVNSCKVFSLKIDATINVHLRLNLHTTELVLKHVL